MGKLELPPRMPKINDKAIGHKKNSKETDIFGALRIKYCRKG